MNLEQLLSAERLVKQAPTSAQIRERANSIAPDPVRLFYGETYDKAGHPVDSLKYYFYVSNLARTLQKDEIKAAPIILVADTAASTNAAADEKSHIMALGEKRLAFIQRVNEIYEADLRVLTMSEIIESPDFIARRGEVIEVCQSRPELMKMIEATVPQARLKIERNNNFPYAFDEVTIIIGLGLDMKVGPPREDLYDRVARKIARITGQKELMSLFLAPTFPLGLSWAYFFVNQGLENHGITAYKAGSGGLDKNRIIVGSSNSAAVRDLIQDSFISTDPSLPNPVLDLGIIAEMARKLLEQDGSPITLVDDFYSGRLSPV